MRDEGHSLQNSQSPSDGQRREKTGQSLFFSWPPNLDPGPLTFSHLPAFMQSTSSVFIHPFIDQHLVGRTVPIPAVTSGTPTVCWALCRAQSTHSHGSRPVFSSQPQQAFSLGSSLPSLLPYVRPKQRRLGSGVRIPNQLLLLGTKKYVLLS